MPRSFLAALALSVSLVAMPAAAQSGPPPYGAPITLAQAKKAMAAAEAEAVKNNWYMVIAIVDAGGNLVMLQRGENAQYGSVKVAQEKAQASVAFRRPTKFWQDLLAQGGVHVRLLNLTGDAGVLEGAVPIIVDGKVVGGIGVSGATSEQDAQVAMSGANALK